MAGARAPDRILGDLTLLEGADHAGALVARTSSGDHAQMPRAANGRNLLALGC